MSRRVAGLGGQHTASRITRPSSSTLAAGGGGGGSGSVSTFTALSRDAGSKAGGATVIATCTGVTGTPAVTVGGVTATVTGTTSTTVTFTTPVYGGTTAVGGSLVDVVIGGVTLANGFEYHPLATVTHVSHDFEDNTLGGFTHNITTGTVAASTDFAYAGTRSCKCAVTGSYAGGGAGLSFTFPSGAHSNPALEDAQGVYLRWYQLIPTASITDVTGALGRQIKLHIMRDTQGIPTTGHGMLGLGMDFPPSDGTLVFFNDIGTGAPPGAINVQAGTTFGDGVWRELELWYYRAGNTGYMKAWVDGKQKVNASNKTSIGSDQTTWSYQWLMGLAVTQSAGNLLAYVDNATAKDGFIDP